MKQVLVILFLPFFARAQFAPAAGEPGTTAIHKDSSVIINWASACSIVRGLQDISNPNNGYASYGDSSKALGKADGLNVVSLGDGGYAVLSFPSPIKNGPGPDFCVFENGFHKKFLELAFVEVSSDGQNFFRFPATCIVQNTLQIGPFDTLSDPVKINNLAGKYVANYGVPFDLQELSAVPGLNINSVTRVKIIDVVGCIQPAYARYDKDNNIINDLWATSFPSSGFDLDGVGVINEVPVSVEEKEKLRNAAKVFPSVTGSELFIENKSPQRLSVKILDISSSVLFEFKVSEGRSRFDIATLAEGNYFVCISNGATQYSERIIKTR